MAFTNNLKKQVDIPVWEWCRLAPTASATISSTCTADNSLYHVSFGRYIYFMNTAAAAAASATGYITGFMRYDTITDTYQVLSPPPLALATYSAMQFAGGQGYNGRVISNGGASNTLQIAGLTGKTLKGFDIRIIGGTGAGQQRIITDVADPVIAYAGTVTTLTATPAGTVIDANANWVINQWVGYQVRYVHVSGQAQTRKIIYNTSTTLYYADLAKFAEDQWAWSPIFTAYASPPLSVNAVGTPYQIESSNITVDSSWVTQPDETSRFVVRCGGIWLISSVATLASYHLQYYDIAGDIWYVRNACLLLGPVSTVGTEASIVNSGENATVFERGTALGTHSKTNLQDTTKSWTTDQWANYSLRIFSGTGEGKIMNIISNTTNSLVFSPVVSLDSTTIASASGASGSSVVTLGLATPINCNGWSITGTNIGANAVIVSGQGTTTLLLSVPNSGTVSGDLTMGTSATGVNLEYTITTSLPSPQTCNGWYVSGTGIGTDSVILSGQGTTKLVLSVANSGTVSGIITMLMKNTANTGDVGSYIVTTTTATPSFIDGYKIEGTGIATGAVVISGEGTTTLTLSLPNTASVTGKLTFTLVPDASSRYFIDAFEVGIVTSVNPPTPIIATTIQATAGLLGSLNITLNSNSPSNCNTWYISGNGIASATPTAIVSGQGTKNLVLSAVNTSAVSGPLIISPSSVTGTLIAPSLINTYVITLDANSPNNCNGWYVSGAGVGYGAYIVSGQGTATLTLSKLNTATMTSGTAYLYPTLPTPNSFTAYFTGTTNTTLNTFPTTILTPYNCNGWYAFGTNIAIGATVVGPVVASGCGTNTLTLSIANTGPVANNVTLSPTMTTATAATGVIGTYTITTAAAEPNTPANCNGWYISGTGIALGATIASGQGTKTLTLSVANTSTVSGVLTMSATAMSTGSISGSVFTAGATTGAYYPGQILLGSGVQTPTTIVTPAGSIYCTTGDLTKLIFTVGDPQAMGIIPGMAVSLITGTGPLGTNTYVTAVSSANKNVTLSVASSLLTGVTLQFGPLIYMLTPNPGSYGPLISVTSTNGLVVGMFVNYVGGTAGGITAGSYITKIDSATTFTISQAPTTILNAAIISFTPYQTMITNQLSGIPGGAGTYSIFPSQGTFSTGVTMTATGNIAEFTITTSVNSPLNCNGLKIFGYGIAPGATIVSGQGGTGLTLSLANTASLGGTAVSLSALTVTSTIIGVGNSVLVDNSKNWPLNRWNNQVLRIKSGTANGDYRAILGTVPGYTTYTSNSTIASSVGTLVTLATGSTTGLTTGMVVTVTAGTGAFQFGTTITTINNSTLFTVSATPTTALASATIIGAPVNTLVTYSTWNTTPDSSSRYVIHGDPDKNYMSFGGQTPTFIHNIESDTVTQGRMLDFGVARGISAQYSDHPPVALLATAPTVPVLPILSAVGYVLPVNVTGTPTSASGITTVTHLGGTFPIGSWIIVGSIVCSGEAYNGTWQVIDSSPGSVKYFNNSGTYTSGGTVTQTNSIALGGTLASGAFATFGAGTTMMISGCVPIGYNNLNTAITVGTSVAAWTSTANSCSGATTLITTTGTNAGLKVGMYLTRTTGGSGLLSPGTFVVSLTGTTQFTLNQAPAVALVGTTLTSNALPAANGGYQGVAVASSNSFTVTLTGTDTTANLRIGMIPVATGGSGTIPAGACINAITGTTTFTLTVAPNPVLSGVIISVVPTVAWAGTVPGNLITAGVVQKIPLIIPIPASIATNSGTTCTLLQTTGTAGTYPVGSWITVSGASPGTYNGVYQVTAAGGEGSVVYTVPVAPSGIILVAPTIGLATITQLATCVNSHSFKTGQYLTMRGDTSFSREYNNTTAIVSTVLQFAAATPFAPIQTTQFTYPVLGPSGPMVAYAQSTTQLCDMAKNWLPNQWAGCMVTYNITQNAGTTTGQPQIVAAYVSANTNNTLIFPAVMTAQAPVNGISRYVITAQANSPIQNSLGCSDSGLALGIQTTVVQLQDVSKAWVTPGGTLGIYVTIPVTAAVNCTVPLHNIANLYIGMTGIILYSGTSSTLAANATIAGITAATGNIAMSVNFTTIGTAIMLFGYGVSSATATTNTATLTLVSGLFVGMVVGVATGSVTLPAGTVITAIGDTSLVIKLSNNFGGTSGNPAVLTFTAPCSSSGNTVTVQGYTTAGLAVGMYVGVLSAANLSVPSPTTGAFIASGGSNITPIKVTSILNATQFTVSATPAVALSNATIIATFWIPNIWNSRKVRITSGLTANFTDVSATGNNHNTLFTLVITPVHGVTGYSILQQPVRALGTAILWNFGASNLNTRGIYLYQARGGVATVGLPGWDRLDIRTDKWDFLMPTPTFEGLTVGAMYAYDSGDRIYFTTSGTKRVYYLDIENMTIHGASEYPYTIGGVLPGNRMEIFETIDGLRYLWLNRNTGQECFKQLLFY